MEGKIEEQSEGPSSKLPLSNFSPKVINNETTEDEDYTTEEEEEEFGTNTIDRNDEDEKHCWVCYAYEEDDTSAAWIHPCRCSGTTKWVHQACILRWVDEKQKGNIMAQVSCPQCGTEYRIKIPTGGIFVLMLDAGDKMIHRVCPIVIGGLGVGAFYWTCVTYGAISLMQVIGHDRGLMIMERADPLFLLVSLPLVPVALVLGKMIRWDEPVLKTLRRVVPNTPILRNILPAFSYVPEQQGGHICLPPVSTEVSATRTFCGGLFFPTIAVFLGRALFPETFGSQMKRTLFGGLTFVFVKGLLKLYHKQQIYIRHCKREIINFEQEATQE